MVTRTSQIDTRSLGLDLASDFVRLITGRENLHYGYWHDGVEVCAANLGQAQQAYSNKVKEFLPTTPHKILDIGGGCGEFAKELIEDGHEVEIVVPSEVLAARCRVNVGMEVPIHVTRLEDFKTEAKFDVCLFAESWQYIPPDRAFAQSRACLAEGGDVVISDCFRTQEFFQEFDGLGFVGGGHSLDDFHQSIKANGFKISEQEDVTERVAPSVDLEQSLYHFLGSSLKRIDQEVASVYPLRRKWMKFFIRRLIEERRWARLKRRLFETTRTSEAFRRYNRYVICRLTRHEGARGHKTG